MIIKQYEIKELIGAVQRDNKNIFGNTHDYIYKSIFKGTAQDFNKKYNSSIENWNKIFKSKKYIMNEI